MVRLRRCLFIVLTLISSGGPVFAASSAENRAFNAGASAFKIESWEYAEKKFGEFVQKYPKSPRAAQAILFQAEARYHLNRFADAIGLLSANRNLAGGYWDEYLYLIAQAHFQNTNYEAAADVFADLIRDCPDSGKRLAASIGEATALGRLGEWPQAATLLQETNGVFQQAAASAPANEFVIWGYLILGEAQLAQRNFSEAEATLELLGKQTLDPELSWRREYLRGRLLLAKGPAEEALQSASNLLAVVGALAPTLRTNAPPADAGVPAAYAGVPSGSLLAESWAFRAAILEQLSRLDDAIAAYGNNLVANAPVDQQRRALLKIAELNLAQNKTASAIHTLEDYLKQHPYSDAADMAELAMGELLLKQYAAAIKTNRADASPAPGATATNLIAQALDRFDLLLKSYSNSPLAGKALLDKGWCYWADGDIVRSEEAFRSAAGRLPPFSEDQAVARFKWADAQFLRTNFPGAIRNYTFVVTNYSLLPEARQRLIEPALYQIVRAALTNDMHAATEAMRTILDEYPDGFAGTNGLFLVGQGYLRQKDPAGARTVFADFEARYPASALLPEVRLAVARSYEQEENWDAAISQYAGWISRFTNHAELPRAEFSRAWDSYRAGQETNALVLFTNFTARFPADELARRAQLWVADFYFRQGDYQKAEGNYQLVFQDTNWPPSELTYLAQMMAGQAAVARLSYKDAIGYFTGLTSNSNCPPELVARALVAYGDAEMNLDTDETNRVAHLNEAIRIFKQILQISATNQFAADALGKIGNCYLQWAAKDPAKYADAADYYQQVAGSPYASVTARSQAKVGLGRVTEGMAGQKSGAEQAALLKQALEYYLDVFIYQNDLRDGEQPDLFWVKEAGLKAARLAESMQEWKTAYDIYRQLETSFPPWSSILEPRILKIVKAHPEVSPEK